MNKWILEKRMNLGGKVVVLTGGSSGIGHALAYELNALNARVYSLDISVPKQKIPGVCYLKADVRKSGQVHRALSAVKGKIDILVNNAGVMCRGGLLNISEKDYDFVMDVNVKGNWLVLRYALPKLRKNATVLQLSSRHALILSADPGIYSLSKAANADLGRIIQNNFPGLKVKMAFPGPADTPLHWRGNGQSNGLGVISPKDLADKLVRLLLSKKSELIYQRGKYFLR